MEKLKHDKDSVRPLDLLSNTDLMGSDLDQFLHSGGTKVAETEKYRHFLQKNFPLLAKFYSWMKTTQAGITPNTFRWRGRTENHTLSSGLDDYPRSKKPSDNETHVDLHCWMTKSAQILSEIATFLGEDSSVYRNDYETFSKLLDETFWNEETKSYCDIEVPTENLDKSFVCHKGYISLFPLLMGFIPKDSQKLLETLNMIKDPKELWSDFGLRSLSVSDPYFGTGENYWKGPIWLNINYLVLSSLHKNYINEGPHSELAKEVYTKLRTNIMNNMLRVFKETHFIWEQYNPNNGNGQRSRPFTGWSSLVILIMAEIY